MKILVTGGGGFLGKYVVRGLLNEGYSVRVFQRSADDELTALGVELERGSLTDYSAIVSALEGCGAVIHIAALAGVWGARKDYMDTNFGGTESLLRAMENLAIRRLVYCSSPSAVFSGDSFAGADESVPVSKSWDFSYPKSKAMAEQSVLEWGRAGKGRAIVLRPHLIWGVGDPHIFPTIIERARAGRLRIIGTGTNLVDTTRVENAAAAHILALKALEREQAVNRTYFISQGQPVVLWDWLNDMLRRVNVPLIEKRLPYPMAYGLGWVCECLWRAARVKRVPPMTRFVAMAMAKTHWFSIEAARRELGYHPEAYPTAEGLDLYAKALRENRTPVKGR